MCTMAIMKLMNDSIMDSHRHPSGELGRSFRSIYSSTPFDSLVPLPTMIIGCAIRCCSPIHSS